MPNKAWRVLMSSLLVLTAGCGNGPSSPTTASDAGQWSGTTLQGMPIAFTVTADLKLTSLTVGYNFNGCTGSVTYAPNVPLLRVPTAPIPIYSTAYQSGPAGSDNQLLIDFLFTSTADAHGSANFLDFSGCGAGLTRTEWTATRR